MFPRLWLAAAVANLGDGMGKVAVPLLAASVTHDPVLVGGIASMMVLPYLIFGIPAGALADRFERRHAMIGANLVRALCLSLLCLGLVAGQVPIAAIFALSFSLAAAECLYDAAADGAVPVLVPVHELDRANSRLQGVITVTNDFLGAPIGAFLFAAGVVFPFAAQLAGFLLAMGVVATLPRLSPHLVNRGGQATSTDTAAPEPAAILPVEIGHQMRAGATWLWRHRSLRGVLLLTALCGVSLELAQSTMVLYAVDEMQLPIAAYGVFASSLAIGALAGVTLAPLYARVGLRRCQVMFGALAVQPLCLAGIGLAPNPVVAFLGIAVFSGAVAVWNVMSATMRQALVPTELFGRVHGAWKTLVWGLLPVGAWTGGLVAHQAGLRAPWLVAAGLLAVTLVAAPPILRRACNEADAVIGPISPPAPADDVPAGVLSNGRSLEHVNPDRLNPDRLSPARRSGVPFHLEPLHHQHDLFAMQARQHQCR